MMQLNEIDAKVELFKSGQRYLLPEEDWVRIYPSEYNVRKTDIEGTVEWVELKASIKVDGITEDLDVTPKGAIWDGQLRNKIIREIVAEEILEYQEDPKLSGAVRAERVIPIITSDLTPLEQTKRSINKNTLRKDVNAHDLAKGIAFIIEELGTQHDAGIFLGQEDTWISERLAVLSTPERTFDKETEKVKEEESKALPLDKVPKGKVSDIGGLISSTGKGSRKLKRVIAEEASKLPRDELKKLKKEVKKEKKTTAEEVLEKIEEKKKKIKATVNRTFRLDRNINDALKIAEGRGLIDDQHMYVNGLLIGGLTELGVLSG